MSFLTTDRLYLEAVSAKHCTQEYCDWLNDAEVNKYLETGTFPYSIEQLADYINSYAKAKNIIFLAVHLKENGKHIGNVKIEPINLIHGTAEYGILIGDKSSWKKGFAKEASTAVFNHCFKTLNLRKITLGVIEDNNDAVVLYQKMGFVIEGNYHKHVYCDGEYRNVVRMALFNPNRA
jgi:ribosomal-protein-alanine N-acetyltransferase